MNQIKILSFVIVFTILGSGCLLSKDSVSSSNLACTYTANSATECMLFTTTTTQAAVDTACTQVSGTLSSSCSTTNLLGTCANVPSSDGATLYLYNAGLITSSSAASALCVSQSGTYTAN
jgi:hypothetical protein